MDQQSSQLIASGSGASSLSPAAPAPAPSDAVPTSTSGKKRSATEESLASEEELAKVKWKRNRKALNCEECRRLKLKCNRKVPCDQCIKRGCSDSCPSGVRPRSRNLDTEALKQRVTQLEEQLNASDNSLRQRIVELGAALEASKSGRDLAQHSRLRLPPLVSGSTSAPSINQNAPGRSFPGPEIDPSGDEAQEASGGTLMIGEDGQQKWLGDRAGSEWLQEAGDDGTATPRVDAARRGRLGETAARRWKGKGWDFPFSDVPTLTLAELLSKLPSRPESQQLADCYYRYSDYNYSPIQRSRFDEHLRSVYEAAASPSSNGVNIHPHQLALVLQAIATGCQHNPELPEGDPLGEYYHSLAQSALTLGHFLQKPTLAAIQTMIVMGHFLLTLSPKAGGDLAWPIWGLAMRLCVAMGLHRDGERWNLEPAINDERRRTFWELQVVDCLQSAAFSRSNILPPDTYDTKFPIDLDALPGEQDGFSTLKFKLGEISNLMLSQIMKVRPAITHDGAVKDHWNALVDFEKSLPFHWRCRPAWIALISIHGSEETGVQTSPEINKLDLKLTFQRHTLALNISETVLFLQRPYFTKALYERPDDPCQSKYAASFLAVFERCLVIIRINQSVNALYPNLALRQWFFWYHTFSAAVCLSAITILAPGCPFASYALDELHGVVALHASAPEGSRPRSTLPALLKILERAKDRLSKEKAGSESSAIVDTFLPTNRRPSAEPREEAENQGHLALLGWTTRLVKSLKDKARQIRSVACPPSAEGPSAGVEQEEGVRVAAEERRKLISDQHLASLSRSISDFKKAATSNTWPPSSNARYSDPSTSASVQANAPDVRDVFDYNSLPARYDRESEEECAQVNDVQDDAEWLDELARQFMMGPSATQSPTARDGSF